MKSIRFYLIATIIAAMTLLMFLSALHGYNKSSKEAKELLDKQLVDMANVLAATHTHADNNHKVITNVKTTNTAFQIWHDKQLITRSHNAPEAPMTALSPGFHDSNFGKYRWRNYVHYNPDTKHWVITAERADTRNRLIDNFILKSVMPVILTLPIAVVLIWLLVGSGLKPLRQLADQLHNKQENDLSPVSLTNPLKELQPLVNSTNTLLARLENALDRAKRFSADAAHELRTPISGLKINLYNLKAESPETKYITLLTAGINRMEHIVEQILTLYRTTPDQYMASFEALDLYDLVQDGLAQHYLHFEEKGQEIELAGSSARMLCDRFTMETLLQNLLSNANKYTPENGNISVDVGKQNDNIRLRVEDSGPGIPEDMYHRIFDRFYRLDGDQHDSDIEGCGLGLSIVQHIVELHHGNITLSKSSFPTGLAITISFPSSSPDMK